MFIDVIVFISTIYTIEAVFTTDSLYWNSVVSENDCISCIVFFRVTQSSYNYYYFAFLIYTQYSI